MTTLAGLVLWSAAHVGLPQFRDKAMPIRLICSPIAALLVPTVWWLAGARGRRRGPFPHVPALLVALALIIDLAGNATGLYVRVEDFDDAVHVLNPMLLVAAVTILLAQTDVPPWAVWVMAFGLGCAGNITWELLEFLFMERGAVGLRLSLRDTLSDQAYGLLGAAVGATFPLLWPSRASAQGFAEQAQPTDEPAANGTHSLALLR